MFSNVKMSKKFIFVGGLLLLIMLIIAYMSQSSISTINKSVSQIDEYETVYKGLKNVERDIYHWREPMINMFLGEELDTKKLNLDPKKSSLTLLLKNKSTIKLFKKEPEIKKLLLNLKKPNQSLFRNASKIVTSWEDGDVDMAIETFKVKLKKSFEELQTEFNKATNFIGKKVEEIHLKSDKIASSSSKALIITLIISILLTLILGFVVIKEFITKINSLKSRVKDIAEGDADLTKTINVDSKDEFGELANYINTFINIVLDIVIKIKESSNEIMGLTEDVADGSDDLSQRTNEQAASITETSTTLEEFTSIVSENSKNSEDANEVLKEFNDDIKKKSELIDNVTNTMEEIATSSKQINNIINVINDISFQTNLLALNAAVEAARAGEAGRGFAVVASEVRNLAGKTADSSKTIKDIVAKNVESTTKGMYLVSETSNFFKEILTVTADILNKVKSISEGSREQTTGIAQINQAISQLDDVINKNAALVQDLSKSSKDMKMNSINLLEFVNTFKIN